MKEYTYNCAYNNITYKIECGENGKENWELIKKSKQNDIWFHVENNSSTHVVLHINDKKTQIHKGVIKYCGELTKQGSKYRHNKNISIMFTEIKNVKINYNDKPGSVYARKTKIIKC